MSSLRTSSGAGLAKGWLRAAAAAIATVLAGAALSGFAAPDPTGAGPEPQDAVVKLLDPVEIVTAHPGLLRETLAISGEVMPGHEVTLSAEIAGLAEQVTKRVGETVARGDLLLTVAAEDYRLALAREQALLASLKVQLRTAEAARDRALRLEDRGAGSLAALDEAQESAEVLASQVAVSEAAAEQARVNLRRTKLHAPFAGVLASRSAEPGQLIQAGDSLFEIVDLSTVIVEALLPLTQADLLHVGQSATLWHPADPARRITARLGRIAPQAAPGTRSVVVYLEIDNAEARLRSGLFLKGEIELRRAENRQALPRSALRDGTAGQEVLAVRDGQAVRIPVTTGAAWHGGSVIEIAGGLRPGETVVALPLAGLAPGDPVRIAKD